MSNEPLHILVAGGAGYIGSIVTALLVGKGYRVTVVDNCSTGYAAAVHPDAAFIRGDIQAPGTIARACAVNVDVAMHFAAFIEVGESVLDPAKYYRNNLLNTVRFFDNLRVHGVDRVIFSSTAAVYGEPESLPLTEDEPLKPLNPYGFSKMAVERVLGDYDTAYGLKSVCFRYFNAGGACGRYGENHQPESHLIPIVFDSYMTGVPLKVYGDDYDTRDGSCVRDYIHVCDLARAHIAAISYLKDGNTSGVFNLGTGTGYTVLEVIRAAETIVGDAIPYTIAERRAGDSASLVASSDRARSLLEWNGPRHSLEAIIESAWHWKQAHPKGYGDSHE